MDALPPDVKTEQVMTASSIDGHLVTTDRFRSAEPPASLLSSVRERWRAAGWPVIESSTGGWRLLSAREPSGYVTVRVRESGAGSEGTVSRWRAGADDAATDVPPSRWLPADARVVRRIVHRDPGRDAATVVAWLPVDPEAASRALRAGASRDGFVDDPALGAPATGAAWYRGRSGAGEALAFRRGREQVVATVSGHDDGAAVVLHWGAAR
jgi:hypothetical protein